MGSAHVAVKKLAKELIGVGKKLKALPSAIDELLMLLEKAESILTKVDQQPPGLIEAALVPLMQMLIADEILHHADVNIQIAVACCFTELTRITAPDYTYKDAYMKELFRLCIIVLKHLSSESGRNYYRALRMLETIAKLKSSAILLDIDGEELIVKMFQLFFSAISSRQPADTFGHMEMIMSFVIQESHKIPFKLLRPILESVKMDKKNISSISWELGNAVFRNCSYKLQRPLKRAVRQKNLDVAKYAVIVASLCHEEPCTENTIKMAKEVGSTDRTSKKTVKRAIAGSSTIAEKIDAQTVIQTSSEGKDESPCFDQENEQIRNRIISKKHESSDAEKRSMSHLGSGEDLIDLRIRVWWPNDREYYPGTIKSFDHIARKHKIIYDDGDEEILCMDEETWEPLDDHQIQHSKKHDIDDPPAPAKKPVEVSKKKKGKSNPGQSKKQKTSSASERAKPEKGGSIKSGEVSVPIVGIKDEPDAEMTEMNSPNKNDENTNSCKRNTT